MAVCANCGKTAVAGSNVSHSVVHTKRRFQPNLQWSRVGGKRVLICMRCKRTLLKPGPTRARQSSPSRSPGQASRA